MRNATRTTVRLGIAAAAVLGLVSSGMSGANAAPRKAALYERPYLDATINDHKLVVHSGGGAFATGQMDLSLSAVGGDRVLGVVRFANGYHFSDFRADIKTFGQSFGKNGPSKAGLKALNHAINHTTGYGGVYAPKGHSRHGTLLLDQEGTYVLYDDSGNAPRHPVPVDISGSVGPQHLQNVDATVRAKTNKRFGGDDVLPANGNIRFKNTSTESPHFLDLEHVKAGTTRKDVIDYLNSGSDAPPAFARKGSASTDALSLGQQQVLHVNLPPGDYAEMCFFPDPKEGIPHAYMGMVRIVHLK